MRRDLAGSLAHSCSEPMPHKEAMIALWPGVGSLPARRGVVPGRTPVHFEDHEPFHDTRLTRSCASRRRWQDKSQKRRTSCEASQHAMGYVTPGFA